MKQYDWGKLKLSLRKHRKQAIGFVLIMLSLLGISFLAINYYVERVGAKYIYPANGVPAADTVLILGAYVLPDGTLSDMLRDRVTIGYELYQKGKAPKIIVSGDHGRQDYDEVNSMKSFIKGKGVNGQDIFMDHAGFSTYESLYRARDIFQADKVIIVTQRYHLLRAIFIARGLGLEAYGVASDLHDYGQVMTIYELREMVARNKDFWLTIIQPQPTFLGEAIPVFGDGGATDDSVNENELKLLAYPEKYALTSSSSPGIRISAQYPGAVDMVNYSTTHGSLLTWDITSGKIDNCGKSIELATDIPIYWTPLENDVLPKASDKISVKVSIINKNKSQVDKQVEINYDGSLYFTVQTSPDVVIAENLNH